MADLFDRFESDEISTRSSAKVVGKTSERTNPFDELEIGSLQTVSQLSIQYNNVLHT